ncbi:hypothetical protein A9Q99_09320 [Gammaproteobacteria bacterium 45_16_T64]|nr:hypothetical protein A9Q99_09320 [Gammaproteobacteria bacterium 45_16_T64]
MNNKKISVQCAVITCVIVFLSGCSWLFGDQGSFRERTMDYKKAQEANPLRFPQGVRPDGVSELYPIPRVTKKGVFVPETAEDIPRPQSILSVDEDLGIEFRTDGEITWLVVDQTKEKLWETLRDFLIASGMNIESEDQNIGLMETAWLKPRAVEEEGLWSSFIDLFTGDDKENTREKFLLTVEQVGALDRYQIHIGHVTRIRTDKGLPSVNAEEWREESENPELLEVLYAEVGDYVADEKSRRGHASIMSQNLTAMPSYLMTRDGNDFPVLMMQMDINRAWIEVGIAIKKAKLDQQDLNLSLGIYYISLGVDEDENPVVYEVKLISAENGVQVAVQIDDDTVAPVEVSDTLLIAISEKLG